MLQKDSNEYVHGHQCMKCDGGCVQLELVKFCQSVGIKYINLNTKQDLQEIFTNKWVRTQIVELRLGRYSYPFQAMPFHVLNILPKNIQLGSDPLQSKQHHILQFYHLQKQSSV